MGRRYKKVDGGHAHHGGAWKVAYADFVTAMMALFMVMWLLASSDETSRKEISNYFRTGILPDGSLSMKSASQEQAPLVEETSTPPPRDKAMVEAAKAAGAKELAEMLAGLAKGDKELAALIKNVKVESVPDGIQIEMIDQGEGLLFDSASAQLKPAMQRFLKEFAPKIIKFNQKLEITGHTDARPFAPGSRLSNWDLSYQRAAAAREILEDSGLPPETVVGVFARGASQLYIPEQPFAPQNRRLTFLIKIPRPAPKPVIVPQPEPVETPAAPDSAAPPAPPAADANTHATPATPVADPAKPAVDDHGKPVVDDLGKPITGDHKPIVDHGDKPLLDDRGNPVLDDHGKPVIDSRAKATPIAKPGDEHAKPATSPAHN